MYITPEMIDHIAVQYGRPKQISMTAPVKNSEFEFIKTTQRNKRAHDVTFYIFNGDKLVVNAKHSYPEGLFRAPSGGLKPGEDFESGIKREAYEETGVKIELEKFLLIIDVNFTTGDRDLKWTSYIFKGRYLSGELKVIDTREIREVRYADLSEFEKFKGIIKTLDWGGLSYRARLHNEVLKLL
ncbi:MAG: NUDIX hydrolase [Candidatus Zixiibacteriota bacterium]